MAGNTASEQQGSLDLVRVGRYALILGAFWTVAAVASLIWNCRVERLNVRKHALSEASGLFSHYAAYRRWGLGHFSVYVPVSAKVRPSAFLAHLRSRDLTTASGKKLTLVNPDYMLPKDDAGGPESTVPFGRITSLSALNPANGPDPWEREALLALKAGRGEVVAVEFIEGKAFLRAMRPLKTEAKCLECHAGNGWTVGDVQGGASVAIPVQEALAAAQRRVRSIALGHMAGWAFGIVLIVAGAANLRRQISKRETVEGELEKSEAQLRQAQKMEAVGRLAAGIAHDFNNILTSIQGFTDFARQSLDEKHPAREDLAEVLTAAERAANLTRQLLAFSRRQIAQPKIVDANREILEIRKLLDRIVGEDVDLQVGLAEGLWRIRIDPTQFEQVIINLSVNARDAMPRGRGGKLTIATSNVTLAPGSRGWQPYMRAGDFVRISVSDTGSGMSPETKAHLFEPFFTTKGPGKGTGLGLATCYGIVKQNGGTIQADSRQGEGTTFIIDLPRVGEALAAATVAPPSAAVAAGTETILVVEDEPQVRAVAVRFLNGQGYRVLVAADGQEALDVLAASRNRGGTGMGVDLVVSDMVMPRMGGEDLGRRLKELCPGLRVLFMTGYSDRTQAVAFAGPKDSLIVKPFTRELFLAKVREILDLPAPGPDRTS